MEEMWMRMVGGVLERTSGPLHFRLILQPVMAVTLAVIAGLKDAKAGKPPYFWGLLTDPAHRSDMLKGGWKSIGKVFVLAWLLDIAYQFIAMRSLYPGGAILVAITLAIVPYLLVRGLVTRIARKKCV